MTYEEIVAKVKKEFGSADVSNYEGHLAIQINVTGEGEGIFYAEINDGKLNIEPYDYRDNDAVLIADGKSIISILNGSLDPVKAYEAGKLTIEGDITKALSIQPVIENNKKPAKKTAAKKPAAKKTATKKTATKKTAAKKVVEAEVRAEADVVLSDAVKKACSTKSTAAKTASKATTAKTAAKAASKTASKAVKDTAVKAAKTAKTGAKKG